MSEIISKWVLHRLGMVIDMTSENFALTTANGLLLAKILQSYEIIASEELNMLKDTDQIRDCFDNFKLINIWLSHLDLSVMEEDIYEIVHGVGSTSLHVFYQVFLELEDKTKLDYLIENEINAQMGKRQHRFIVTKVNDNDDAFTFNLHKDKLCEPVLAGGDVYHWYKDRFESLQSRCQDAREEYRHSFRNIHNTLTTEYTSDKEGEVLARGVHVSIRSAITDRHFSSNDLPIDDLDSLDERTYEDLITVEKKAQNLPLFTPDPKEAKKIVKKLHNKSKIRLENKLLRNQLHREIMNEFDRKITNSKAETHDRFFIDIFMKQSLYEKELITKLGQTKTQKEYMVENKFRNGEELSKIKEKNFMDALILKDKELNEKQLIYYIEQERIIQLHKKIWNERLRLRAKRIEELCSNALKDMVDISVKISEHKKRFGREPNRRETEDMKNLFVSGQPIFDICKPVIEILKDNEDDIPDTIVTREMDRQNALDQEEFNAYMRYEWPWELENVNTSSEVLQEIDFGLSVLGNIVHRALQAKHPIIPLRDTPNFPDATIRVCINGLKDTSILPSLTNLLSERDIKVIELTQSLDYCIEAYRKESIREYPENENGAVVKEVKQKKEKPTKPKKGEKSKKNKNNKTDDISDDLPRDSIKPTENKLVQTPIKYPCEEIPYSRAAILGRTAQDILDEGSPLGDFLLIDMFVEYLLSIENLKGWVLVNYPTTFEQASILEEALTGLKLVDPKSTTSRSLFDIADNEQTDDINTDCSSWFENSNGDLQTSLLLPNPIQADVTKVYDTILTAYIKMRKLACDEKSGDGSLPPGYEELGNEPDPLDKFYSNAGANYSMYYKEYDLTTIKYLGKLIIGDFGLPLKSSVELFGDVPMVDCSSKSARAAQKGEKIKKPREKVVYDTDIDKSSTKIITDKTNKKGKTKLLITFDDKSVQVPSDEEDEFEEILILKPSVSELPSPGQVGWEYAIVECPEELLVALGTLWENTEEIYSNDFRQIFFLKRLNLDSIMPFTQYVKDAMKKIIDRPDYKRLYLSKFQKAFNAFEMDFRKDDEFKAEMHCRIEDFKEKLVEMADMKMMESENVRCRIIEANWAPYQITELINNYINILQIEVDRFIQSIRFINDYYLGVMIGLPTEEYYYKEEYIPKFRDIKINVVNSMFEDRTSTVNLSYFDEIMSSAIQKVLNCVKRLNALATTSIEKTQSHQVSKQKSKSKTSSPKSKVSKDTKKTADQNTNILSENGKLIEEWQCAVKGETLRIILRTDLLKFNSLKTIEEVSTTIQHMFHDVYDEVRSKYSDEIENINKVSNVFQLAVENQKPVQKELLFQGQTFCINPEINLFDNPPIIPELSKETVEECAFSIAQLSKLADIFLDLSPSGYIPRAHFTFILQDMLWVTPENQFGWLSPKLWRCLEPTSLRKVVDSLYDDLEYIYWRDFIIYNIRVNYPTERELLVTRRALRECDPDATELIQDYQFFATKLWFEYAFEETELKRITDIKKLLYKLYSIRNYGLNYTALLLDFCKDENSWEGFTKALELSIGKLICWDQELGHIFAEEYRHMMKEHEENVKIRDEERADHYKATYEEVTKLVDNVVHLTEDVIIEDLEKPETNESNRGINAESILKKSIVSATAKTKNSSKKEELRFSCPVVEVKKEIDTIIETTGESTIEEPEPTIEEPGIGNCEMVREDSQTVKIYSELPDNVGTESNESTQLMFFISLESLITVITAALPWHSRVQNYNELSFWEKAAQIFDQYKNPDFNLSVLSYEFLNSDLFLELLSKTKKFNNIDPVRVVSDILKEKQDIPEYT